MAYATSTWVAGIFSALVCLGQLVNLVYASWHLHTYRREAKKLGAASRPNSFPMMLRMTYVACCASATLCGIAGAVEPWLFTVKEISIDPFERTSVAEFDLQSQFCTVLAKGTSSIYGLTKLFSYLFFFIKQRTVRPLSKPSRLEKLVFVATLGVLPFAAMIAVIGEGEQNTDDGTCQLNMAAYMLGTMAGLDIALSALYLYLFIQPLRETIAANQAALTYATGSNGHLAHPTATVTIKDDTTTHAPPPVLNNALERVMRTNAYACIATVFVSTFAMMFLLVSHLYENQAARKWGTPIGVFDIFFSSLALTHIMSHRDRSRTSIAPAGEDEPVTRKASSGMQKEFHHPAATEPTSSPATTPSMPTRARLLPAGSVSLLTATSPVGRSRPHLACNDALRPSLSVGLPNSIAESTEDGARQEDAQAAIASPDQVVSIADSPSQAMQLLHSSMDMTSTSAVLEMV